MFLPMVLRCARARELRYQDTLFFLIFASIKFRDFKKFAKFSTRTQKIVRNLNTPNLIPFSETKQ